MVIAGAPTHAGGAPLPKNQDAVEWMEGWRSSVHQAVVWRLLNILSIFRYKAYVLTSDLQRFAMDTPKNRNQLNALVSYIARNSS
eukprot:10058751-Alexandrium_andersonii.AAC.1